MKGIRMRVISEMKKCRIVVKTKLGRRYSYDDYFLIDNQFQKCFTMNGIGSIMGNSDSNDFMMGSTL